MQMTLVSYVECLRSSKLKARMSGGRLTCGADALVRAYLDHLDVGRKVISMLSAIKG